VVKIINTRTGNVGVTMSIFKCDFKKKKGCCGKKPYMEIFPFEKDEDGKWKPMQSWCFLCLKHYIFLRIQKLFRRVNFGCCRADTFRQSVEENKEILWDIQSDLYEIKEKLGIEQEVPEELEKLLGKKKGKRENIGYE